MLQFLLYFFTTEVESIKDITFILAVLWDVIQLFNGEHRAKVIVHYVGHVIVGCANNSFQSFEWPYVVLYYSSLVDIRVKALGLCLQILAMLNSLLRFSCFTILLTCLLAAMYSATVSSLLILLYVS